MQRIIGIYQILNKVTEKCYIGLSVDIMIRFSRHKSKLKHNKHSNEHLQLAYNKYGLSNFEFNILEECTESSLGLRELYYIKKYKSDDRMFGYNKTTGGHKFRHNEESKRKSAENRTYNTGKNSDNPKTFKFTEPNGKEHIVIGEFESFCVRNELSYRTMRRNINMGIIKPYSKSNPTPQRINCNGWCVQKWMKEFSK